MANLTRPQRGNGLKRAPSLPDTVARLLRQEIADGLFAPGQQLPVEQQLVDRFRVSRAVIREAVARLRNDGVVETFQGRGVFVADAVRGQAFRIDTDATLRREEMEQIFELRIVIETKVAALAAERRTARQLEVLGKALQQIRSASPGLDLVEKDMRFHAAIADACGNSYMREFAMFMDAHVRASVRAAVMTGEPNITPAALYAEHMPIYDAIRRRDARAAEAAATAHLVNAAADLSIDVPGRGRARSATARSRR